MVRVGTDRDRGRKSATAQKRVGCPGSLPSPWRNQWALTAERLLHSAPDRPGGEIFQKGDELCTGVACAGLADELASPGIKGCIEREGSIGDNIQSRVVQPDDRARAAEPGPNDPALADAALMVGNLVLPKPLSILLSCLLTLLPRTQSK